jgi:hypothetical protein
MATLAQKIEAEKRMRDLLEENDLPQPDYVEYGFTCIRLFFEHAGQIVVIDIDEPEDADAAFDEDVAWSDGDRAGGRDQPATNDPGL